MKTRLKTYLRNDAQSLQNERDEIFTDVSLKLKKLTKKMLTLLNTVFRIEGEEPQTYK